MDNYSLYINYMFFFRVYGGLQERKWRREDPYFEDWTAANNGDLCNSEYFIQMKYIFGWKCKKGDRRPCHNFLSFLFHSMFTLWSSIDEHYWHDTFSLHRIISSMSRNDSIPSRVYPYNLQNLCSSIANILIMCCQTLLFDTGFWSKNGYS